MQIFHTTLQQACQPLSSTFITSILDAMLLYNNWSPISIDAKLLHQKRYNLYDNIL